MILKSYLCNQLSEGHSYSEIFIGGRLRCNWFQIKIEEISELKSNHSDWRIKVSSFIG